MQTDVSPLLGRDILLQKLRIGINLGSEQIGHLQDTGALAKILAYSLLFCVGIGHKNLSISYTSQNSAVQIRAVL